MLLIAAIVLSVILFISVARGAFVLHREITYPPNDASQNARVHLAFVEDVQISGLAIVLFLPLALIAMAYMIYRPIIGETVWKWSLIIAVVACCIDFSVMTYVPFKP